MSESGYTNSASINLTIMSSFSFKLTGIIELRYFVGIFVRYIKGIRTKLDYVDPHVLDRVLFLFKAANVVHRGQHHKGENLFIIHPIAIAVMRTEMCLHRNCVKASLLHGIVKDTHFTLYMTLRRCLEQMFVASFSARTS